LLNIEVSRYQIKSGWDIAYIVMHSALDELAEAYRIEAMILELITKSKVEDYSGRVVASRRAQIAMDGDLRTGDCLEPRAPEMLEVEGQVLFCPGRKALHCCAGMQPWATLNLFWVSNKAFLRK
jgi:hypothetical protein